MEGIMNKKKVFAYIVGGTCAAASALGMILLIPSKPLTLSTAIVMICLSLASGLLIPNPISFLGLMAGICMIIFPSWVVGIIFMLLGIAGAIVNLFVAKRKLII